jgi:hypothetical protein
MPFTLFMPFSQFFSGEHWSCVKRGAGSGSDLDLVHPLLQQTTQMRLEIFADRFAH